MKKLLITGLVWYINSSYAFNCEKYHAINMEESVVVHRFKCTDDHGITVVAIPKSDKLRLQVLSTMDTNKQINNLRLLDMMAEYSTDIESHEYQNILVGINGGFFNMLTSPNFKDEMCPMKDIAHAGQSDSALYIKGEARATNCIARPLMIFADGHIPRLILKSDPNDNLGDYNLPDKSSTSMLGGGPVLVHDSKIYESALYADESYPWIGRKAPRSAIATKKSGEIYLISSGTPIYDKGEFTIPELASFLHDNLHVDEAMNLDGGQSNYLCNNYRLSDMGEPEDESAPCNSKMTSYRGRRIHNGIFLIKK
jgi:exopolysaccharide biosynthesis protein